MKPAVELFCEDCGTELLVGNLTKRKPRRVVCSKCFRKYKEKEEKGVKK